MANNLNGNQRSNNEVTFELLEHIGVLEKRKDGWTKEVNIVAWNGGQGKIDIRDWDPEHERMGRGITLFEDTAEKLSEFLTKRYSIRPAKDRAPEYGRPAQMSEAPGTAGNSSRANREMPQETYEYASAAGESAQGMVKDSSAAGEPAQAENGAPQMADEPAQAENGAPQMADEPAQAECDVPFTASTDAELFSDSSGEATEVDV